MDLQTVDRKDALSAVDRDALTPEVLAEIRNLLTQELKERKINPAVLPIVNRHLENRSISQIADEFKLNVLEVTLILEKPEIKNYINQWLLGYSYLNRLKRVDLMQTVIDKYIAEAEEYDAPYSKKDLLDWVKALQKEVELIGADSKRSAPTVTVNTQVNNNIADMVSQLLEV